ncbi:aKG-HExxH-type peptide beta-hydroxylase [Nonomuraea antimicrobica]
MLPTPIGMTNVSAVESRLANGVPFGSYQHISSNLSAIYAELLALVATRSSAAAKLLQELEHVDHGCREVVFRDSLVRRTIEDGVCGIVQGADAIDSTTLDKLLLATAEKSVTTRRPLLNETADIIPFGPQDHFSWHAWTDDHPATPAGRRFQQEVLKRLPGFRIEVPSADQIGMLDEGARLGLRIVPDLVRSAMSHAFMVVVGEFTGGEHHFKALTTPGLPGVIILSPNAFSGAFDMAETLLHESLHLKFLDIDYVSPLFTPGFRSAGSPRVTPVWHQDRPGYGNWPIDRVLTSMHVYLTLAVFLENAGSERAAQCRTRSAWLFENVQCHLGLLTPAGREFVASIGEMLAVLSDR